MTVSHKNFIAAFLVSVLPAAALTGCQSTLKDVGSGIESGVQAVNPFSDDVEIENRIYDEVAVWGPEREEPDDNDDPPPRADAECRANRAVIRQEEGKAIDRSYEFRQGIYSIRVAEDYLNDILREVIACVPMDNPPPARAYIEPLTNIGGRADSDGSIIVTMNFLQRAESDDHVAYMLAHEYSHILLNHSEQTEFAAQRRKVMGALGTMSDLAAAVGPKVGGKAAELNKKLRGPRLLLRTSEVLFEPSWGRRQEFEADLMAYDLVTAAGYVADTAFQQFILAIGRADSLEERIEKLNVAEIASSSAWKEFQSTGSADAAKDAAIGEALQGGIDVVTGWMSDTHPTKEEREELILSYREAHYAEEEEDLMASIEENTVSRLVSVLQSEEFKRAALSFETANSVLTGLAKEGDEAMSLAKAEKDARSAVSGSQFANSNQIARLAFYQVRYEQKDLKNARRNLEIAIESGRAPLSIYETLYRLDMEMGNKKRAGKVLDQAQEAFPETNRLLPATVHYLDSIGKKEEANRVRLQCLGLEDEDLKARCKAGAVGT